MTLRLHTFLAGLFALIAAALLALVPAGASPASGGYQPFKPAALAEKLDVTPTEARDLLAAELLRRVSDDFSGRLAENPEVSRYIDAHAPADLVKDGQHLFVMLDRDSAEYLNSTINMANFNQGFDGRSTLDLYQFDVAASGGSPAALTAFSGVRQDLTNYRQTYTREAEGNALMAGLLLSSIWAEQGSETTAEGKALQAEDPVKWQETQNWATALSNTMSGSYVNGAFKGKPLAPFSKVDPTASTFDIFDYYAMRNLANGAVAVTGVSAGAMASRFAKLRAEMKASAGAGLEKSGLATNTGRAIEFDGQFYSADGFKFSQSYYEYLYNNGRPAPFLQAREVLNSNPKVMPDPQGAAGYFRYEGAGLEMIYNPTTGQVGHIQPLR